MENEISLHFLKSPKKKHQMEFPVENRILLKWNFSAFCGKLLK